MPVAQRSGISLVELTVALVLFGVVATVLFRMLVANQRIYQFQTQRIDRRQSIRAAEAILPAELRELAAVDGDIVALSPTSIRVRAMRQLGFVCAAPRPGATHLVVRERPMFGLRAFDPATDSLLVYVAAEDRWVTSPLFSIGGAKCDDGSPARQLATSLAASVPAAVGAPVRGFEMVTYRLYRAGDGQWQIGVAAGPSGGIQPLVGPVTATGLELLYLDAAGVAASEPARVAAIEIRLRAPTAQPVRRANGTLGWPVDSSVVVAALRNNRQP